MRRVARRGAAVMGVAMSLFSCAGTRPPDVGAPDGRLAPCPGSPNCVSSEAERASQRVEPLVLALPAERAWPAIREAVAQLPRARLAAERPGYLHAECASALFGFVDDLELVLRREEGVVALRSASRVGYSDMGVNRRRVEGLRDTLRRRGVLR